MSQSSPTATAFGELYGPRLKAPVADLARAARDAGADPAERARDYADRGKPEFVLAYLLLAPLPDEEKHALYAQAHDQRAINTERQAQQFDRRFHRAFPLLFSAAARDRAVARAVRAGKPVPQAADRHLPVL